MNISLNTNTNMASVAAGTVSAETKATAASQSKAASPALQITEADVSPLGSISSGWIPEGALDRNDDLGKLLSSAYNLEAPPMPQFV